VPPSRSTMTGTAPSAAVARVMLPPIPLAPPVMITTLFLSCRSTSVRLESVKSSCITAEDFVLMLRRVAIHVLFHDLLDLRVGRSQQANGPVRTEHQSLWSKGAEYRIQKWREICPRPPIPVRFGDQPRKLAVDVRL